MFKAFSLVPFWADKQLERCSGLEIGEGAQPRNSLILTKGKVVVHLAKEFSTLERYVALKELRIRRMIEGRLGEVDEEISVALGRLLGYDDATIEGLFKKPRF